MKLLKSLVALLVVAGFIVPAVAIAEDRLSLSGEMRVRAFHTDLDKDSGDTETWANQRLRIAGKIAVAEGVSVTFRTDITEGTDWGNTTTAPTQGLPIRTNGFGHARSGAQQQWDRAHLDVTLGNFALRAGQQYVGTGGAWAVDTQDSGLRLDMKGDLPVTVYAIVDKDGDSKNVQDSFLYGVTVAPKFGDSKLKLFGAGYKDMDEEVYLAGVAGDLKLGPVNLFAELDYFTGDASSTVDAVGTQLFVDASLAASDMITVGGQLFYALGTDDPDEQQYVLLGNGFNGWDPINDVGTSLSNEEISFARPFDFAGANAGVMGANIYGSFKLSDSLTLGAKAGFYGVEEDAITDEELVALAAGLVYGFAENTSFQLQLQSWSLDEADKDIFAAGTGIFVKF